MLKMQALVLVVLAAGGCWGTIVGPVPPAEGGSTADPGAGAAPAPPVAGFVPAPATLRRLTRAQYTNAVRDLLGADVTVPADLPPDTVLSGFASIGSALTTVSATAAEKFESAAGAIAGQVVPTRPAGAGSRPARPPGRWMKPVRARSSAALAAAPGAAR